MLSAAYRFDGRAMNILSIQSHVAYGHVGNSAAVFAAAAARRRGVADPHRAVLQPHRLWRHARGRVFDAAHIRELVQGLRERGVLGDCDGVLSGYMGSAEIGAAILDAVARGQARQSDARSIAAIR